ncbi:MAG: sigma factor-like helix-turn-helix DNA-binding protein, partial [Methylococcaceae bacterium]
LLWAAKPRGSIPHVINSIKTKSDGQALRVSLVKLVVYLSTNYKGRASEQTWLIGILKYKIIDYFRRVSRERTQQFDDQFFSDLDDIYFDEKGSWQIDFSPWSKPDKSLEQDQFMKILQVCMDRLPSRMAQLFLMSELDGMQKEEICEVMSISTLNNYWVMLSRVKVKLRHCLDINWINQ